MLKVKWAPIGGIKWKKRVCGTSLHGDHKGTVSVDITDIYLTHGIFRPPELHLTNYCHGNIARWQCWLTKTGSSGMFSSKCWNAIHCQIYNMGMTKSYTSWHRITRWCTDMSMFLEKVSICFWCFLCMYLPVNQSHSPPFTEVLVEAVVHRN